MGYTHEFLLLSKVVEHCLIASHSFDRWEHGVWAIGHPIHSFDFISKLGSVDAVFFLFEMLLIVALTSLFKSTGVNFSCETLVQISSVSCTRASL